MARLRCLYGVNDDLHAFTERMLGALPLGALNAPCSLITDHTLVQCAILHREGPYQVELVVVRPDVVIPLHTHPGTDSIEWAISGAVRFEINGERPFESVPDERLLQFVKGKGIRIASDAVHGGTALPCGAMFLSFQRWAGPQGHIGENYVGGGVSPRHDALKATRA